MIGLEDDSPNLEGCDNPQVDQDDSLDARLRETKKRPRPSSSNTSDALSTALPAQYISDGGEDNEDMCDASDASSTKREVVPPLSNPLHQSRTLLINHAHALRLEAELAPMRVIVARLMTNPTHNRRGIFNSPVDPVKLNLVDYTKIIERPMDLGTIKAKLHAVAYKERAEVVADIRLVFKNAMRYNPPENTVHICAKHLMKQFDEWYEVTRLTKGSFLDEPDQTMVDNPKVSLPVLSAMSPSPPVVSPTSPAKGLRSSSISSPRTRKLSAKSLHDTSITAPLLVKDPALKDSNQNSDEDGTKEVMSLAGSIPTDGVDQKASTSSISLNANTTPQIHIHANWKDPGPMDCEKALKRAMSIANKHAKHSCGTCLGRSCGMCRQGCLQHEPSLLICTGSNCGGTKIRKGATYYIARDGSRQFCQRCYSNLQAVIPHTSDQLENMGTAVRYKRDLLKRRNDEEVHETWLSCTGCKKSYHKVCVMFNEFSDSEEDWSCPSCIDKLHNGDNKPAGLVEDMLCSFISGSETPVKVSDINDSIHKKSQQTAEALPQTAISEFIERKVRQRVREFRNGIADADKTVTVRMISTSDRCFKVPDVVRKHFRMLQESDRSKSVVPPAQVHYKSKAMMLFQKIDGLDVCIFCMYVQEYDGVDDEFENQSSPVEQEKRVYIAYLDSVEHFRPRACRTMVYHEMLVAYLATARARGFENAHIWACPPSRGNSFVFWNHPPSQRTPTKERLIAWYHGALSRAIDAGVVTDVNSLYESNFRSFMESQEEGLSNKTKRGGMVDGRLICPPLLDGDFWIEEAVRAHAANVSRFMRSRSSSEFGSEPSPLVIDPLDRGCPATEIATMLRDRVIPHTKAVAFRKPVNAVAMKLKDYHKIIKNPMDLGTMYSHCILGEYSTLRELVLDAELVFANAMRYNPRGNPVHSDAVHMRQVFFVELEALVGRWKNDEVFSPRATSGWERFSEVSLSLDARILVDNNAEDVNLLPEEPIVVSCDEAKTPTTTARIVVPAPVVIESSPSPSPIPVREHATKGCISSEASAARTPSQSATLASLPARNDSIGTRVTPRTSSWRKPISLHSPTTIRRTSSFRSSRNDKEPPLKRNLGLLRGGSEAIEHRMVGDDTWLLEKHQSSRAQPKKANGKRRKSGIAESEEEQPAPKRRRQAWLAEEVGASVRRMRTVFFTCHLQPKSSMTVEERSKVDEFQDYIRMYEDDRSSTEECVPSALADQRHALLEFSQFRNLEFDTLRKAKYSTSILLYHLHNQDAPGLVPHCTSCSSAIEEVRWHRVRATRLPRGQPSFRRRSGLQTSHPEMPPPTQRQEELCGSCFEKVPSKESVDFIPLPVSFKND